MLVPVDLPFAEVAETRYDLALFASGYEPRCVDIARRVGRDHANRSIVFGFEELRDYGGRPQHDAFFREYTGSAPILVGGEDDELIYQHMNEVVSLDDAGTLRILLDYSSMSRVWYAAVLSWARWAQARTDVVIDCVYSVGAHQGHTEPLVIKDFIAIPGCEGGALPMSQSVAVFGLGFDGLATLCVLDYLEADIVYSYFASPAASADYPRRARKENKELIGRHAGATVELPLGSVQTTFSRLGEIIAPHRSQADIVMVPMGPKPHVLAAILLAMRFEEITCLRVSGTRMRPEEVKAMGDVVATRIAVRGNCSEGVKGT